jgi:hypothetical protein
MFQSALIGRLGFAFNKRYPCRDFGYGELMHIKGGFNEINYSVASGIRGARVS